MEQDGREKAAVKIKLAFKVGFNQRFSYLRVCTESDSISAPGQEFKAKTRDRTVRRNQDKPCT